MAEEKRFSMKASKFTESQIAFVLKQGEEGTPVAEICRKAGISQATYFNWKKKFGGLLPSEVKRLRQLEEENNRLKRIVADLSLDNASGRHPPKCMVRPVRARDVIEAESSLRKCIRPLASGLRLQPGHDEICTRRSQIAGSGMEPAFGERAYAASINALVIRSTNLAICRWLKPRLVAGARRGRQALSG
jgi:putative transposase